MQKKPFGRSEPVGRITGTERVAFYAGSVTTSGKSGALRLESAFFKGNPEFAQRAKIRAQRVSPGYVLLSVEEPPPGVRDDDVLDPMVGAFLSFLERELIAHPENIQPLRGLENLLAALDTVEPLRDDDGLPGDFAL